MADKFEFAVVYIMGRGHSGSTVLDLVLGNHEMIESVGELSSGFYRRSEQCSCQAIIDECGFWGSIRQKLRQLHPETSFDEYSKMLNYMDRFYRIPQIKTQLGLPDWVKTKYNPITYDLYALISHQSGKPYIVDSSKEFGRAYYLLTQLPVKTKVIHLVRDGRGVMWSVLKRLRSGKPFKFMRRVWNPKRHWPIMLLTALSWIIGNMLGSLICHFHKGRVLRVRYEDLCNNPTGTLGRIGAFLDLDMTRLAMRIEKTQQLSIGHNIGGNHMRHSASGIFTFKPDFAWRKQLPMKYKLLFLLFSLPLAVRYGYLRLH